MNQSKGAPIIYISKVDAAKRQLETAITLYFRNSDPVSIHALTMAAYDILWQLCKAQGITANAIKDAELVRPDKKKEFADMMNSSQNFFKHADKDPDKNLDFRPKVTEFFINEACRMYELLSGETIKSFQLYKGWFITQHPDLFSEPKVLEAARQLQGIYSENQRWEYYTQMSEVHEAVFK